RWAANPIILDNFSQKDIRNSIKKLLGIFYKDFFSNFYNPIKFINNMFFLKTLLMRYIYFLKDPARLARDLFFYLTYFNHRRGRD
ncbi:MAG: hypothetical protein ABIA63_00110, partial [bacterium]